MQKSLPPSTRSSGQRSRWQEEVEGLKMKLRRAEMLAPSSSLLVDRWSAAVWKHILIYFRRKSFAAEFRGEERGKQNFR